MVTSPWRERREVWSWREKLQVRIFGKGKCNLIANCANFGKGKCKFIANFSATMVTSLPSFSLSLSVSLSLSLSLSPKVPHAQYRKRFRASYNDSRMKTLTTCSRPLNEGECLVAIISIQFAVGSRVYCRKKPPEGLVQEGAWFVFKTNCRQFK